MRLAGFTSNDGTNSITGFTFSIFTQGCIHQCKGCFSESTWDYNGGSHFDLEELKDAIVKSRHKNVSLLGGDPFHPDNRDEVLKLIDWIKNDTDKILYVWTGFLKEQVDEWLDTTKIDYLIDGPFEVDKQDSQLLLRGSSNQNIYEKGIKREE